MYLFRSLRQKCNIFLIFLCNTGERNEICPHPKCGKSYTSKVQLRQHDLLVHGKCASGKYECEVCFSRWRSMEALKRHLTVIHRLTGVRQETDGTIEVWNRNESKKEDLSEMLWKNIQPETTSSKFAVKVEPGEDVE